MPVQYIMIPAALLGLYGLFICRDAYARLIIILMLVSVVMTFLPSPTLKTMGFATYAVALVLTMVYALLKKGFTNGKRALLPGISIPAFLAIIFQLNHWPAVNIMYGLSAISLLAFLLACIRFKEYRDEAGFLFIIAGDALIHLIMFFDWQMYTH